MLLEQDEGLATIATPGAGELKDLSPKLCPTNLPFVNESDGNADDGGHERSSLGGTGEDGTSLRDSFWSDSTSSLATLADGRGGSGEGGEAVAGVEMLAHGAAFVGRHLEIHKIIHSCLHNQLTAVYGERGAGKSALILEGARYLRQRNRFPHGIFCCSLEGLKTMKAVRTRLGLTLNLPARSASDLYAARPFLPPLVVSPSPSHRPWRHVAATT